MLFGYGKVLDSLDFTFEEPDHMDRYTLIGEHVQEHTKISGDKWHTKN
jgi:hypothetical protein